MKERDINLGHYAIGRDRYRELKYFCRQYPGWKDEMADMPNHGGRKPSAEAHMAADPTAREAVRRAELSRKCGLVERAAAMADNGCGMYSYLVASVTNGRLAERAPCGANQFYALRRRFFYILDNLKE